MRNLITLLSLLFLIGCTHIRLVSFDRQVNTVTIQGGKWDKNQDYEKAAMEACHSSRVTLLKMDETSAGSETTYDNNFSGSANIIGSATTTPIKRWNRTFKCESP